MLLIYLSCAWVAGILLGSKFPLPWPLVFAGLVPLCLLFFTSQHKRPLVLISLCLLVFIGGALRFESSLDTSLQYYNDQGQVVIRAVVDEAPEVKDKVTHLRAKATEIKLDGGWQEVGGTVLLFVPRYSAHKYGDILLVTGNLETPPQFDDFDYRTYLAHQGIYSTMLYPQIEVLESGRGSPLLAAVYSLRNSLSRTLAEVIPEPQASLAQGIVLGIRGNIPPSLKENFSRTGTAHLLAISGLHLSIVAGILLSLGIWLFGRKHYLYVWLALGAIWLYTLITGMHPPVVRGAIMASLFLMAELLGRQRTAITSLAFAAAVMVGFSPQILWQVSFQLSFLAMVGLIFIFPRLRAIGRRSVSSILGEDGAAASAANFLIDSLSVTLAAILVTWPIVAHYFGVISLVGPLATLLSLPALPAIFIIGVLTGGLGLVALPLAQVMGWLAWLFLSYLLLVVNGFAALPASAIDVDKVDISLIAVYYSALAIVLWVTSRKARAGRLVSRAGISLGGGAGKSADFISRIPKRWVVPPLLVLAVLASTAAAAMPDDKLHVSFLDVGQGDAILIQTPAGQDILVDGGPSPQAIGLALGQKMPFWDRTIDLVVLSHSQADHITGLLEVLQRYNVEQVLYPDLEGESLLSDQWLGLIEEKGIKNTIAQTGQRVVLSSGVIIEVLNPPASLLSNAESDLNNEAVVLRVSFDKVSFLLTGDIMRAAELELIMRRAGLGSTILKVAHHGSDTSTTPEFLAVVAPHLAVISVGKDNRFGHPSAAVLERLIEEVGRGNVFRTDEDGSVEFITDGERLWVKGGS